MVRSAIQAHKGLSLLQFLRLYSTEQQCEVAMRRHGLTVSAAYAGMAMSKASFTSDDSGVYSALPVAIKPP